MVVGHDASCVCVPNFIRPGVLRPSSLWRCLRAKTVSRRSEVSLAFGEVHPASAASADNAPPAWFGPPLEPSVDRVVFHPFRSKKQSLPDVRRAVARRRGILNPKGVTFTFKVRLNKVDPAVAK